MIVLLFHLLISPPCLQPQAHMLKLPTLSENCEVQATHNIRGCNCSISLTVVVYPQGPGPIITFKFADLMKIQ
jgi:hypothetical protein